MSDGMVKRLTPCSDVKDQQQCNIVEALRC